MSVLKWARAMWRRWVWDIVEYTVSSEASEAKRPRARMARCACPRCGRQVAYSSVTQRTARHQCREMFVQCTIGPHSEEIAS